MLQIFDLHIHSSYSRACSRALNLENIEKTCRIKGVDVIATGDFTHPKWFASLKNELVEADKNKGFYQLKNSQEGKIKFIFSTELSLVYKDEKKCRRIHLVLHAPNIEAVEELNRFLGSKYNIRSDGRPILGISAPELVKLCLKIHPQFLIYPAHIWTPWYSVFGSKSGFDSMEECFLDQTPNIYAYETGLSSDPEMNWRLSILDHLTLLSNSDAHSLDNIAREATVFNFEKLNYQNFYEAIKYKKNIQETLEFYPEEGMYHYDGHRDCGVCFSPAESAKNYNLCPRCKKPLVIGVDNRVNELADRPIGFKPNNVYGFKKIVELDKIIAQALKVKSRKAKKVQIIYHQMIKILGNELEILLNTPIEKIERTGFIKIAEGISRVRNGELKVSPGYDGQYGEVKIFEEEEKRTLF